MMKRVKFLGRLALWAILLSCFCTLAEASIAFDNATDGGNNGGTTTSLTFNHTSTGTNLIGFILLEGDVATGADDITSVTWDGNPCILVKKLTTGFSDNTNSRMMYVYYIIAPPTGSKAILISATGTHYLLAGALTYTGAAQSSQPDAFTSQQSATTAATSQTTSITTTTDNSWVLLMEEGFDNFNPPGAGTGSTFRTASVAFGNWGGFDSNGAITPAGSYSMTTTRGASTFIGIDHILVSFKPAGAGPTCPKGMLPLLGVSCGAFVAPGLLAVPDIQKGQLAFDSCMNPTDGTQSPGGMMCEMQRSVAITDDMASRFEAAFGRLYAFYQQALGWFQGSGVAIPDLLTANKLYWAVRPEPGPVPLGHQ